jgi:hypothetical protein
MPYVGGSFGFFVCFKDFINRIGYISKVYVANIPHVKFIQLVYFASTCCENLAFMLHVKRLEKDLEPL